MDGLRGSTTELRANLEAANEKLMVAERAVADIQTQKEKKFTELEMVLQRSNQASKAKSALEQKLASIQGEVTQMESDLATKQGQVKDSEQRRAVTKKLIEGLSQEQSILQSQIRDQTLKLEDLRNASAGNGRSGVVAAVMNATKKGGPLFGMGIRGRLGDLGEIASEYDVAVSSACSMLDFVVVDTAAAAERAIEFLRASKQGRGNFIALDQIGKAKEAMLRPVHPPSNAARIFDLIKVHDEAVRPAFYLALKDTLVTQDLNAATAIAYEGNKVKWRVVTMDGKLIDMSGAMTGGGEAPKSGGMQLSSGKKIAKVSVEVSPADVLQVEEELKSLQLRLNECRASLLGKEGELQALDNELRQLSGDMEQIKASLPRLVQQAQDASQGVNRCEAEVQLTAAEHQRKEELSQSLQEIEQRMLSAAPDLLVLRENVKSLQDQIFNVGGPRLKRAQLKLDETVTKLDQLSSEISRYEIESKNAEKQGAKAKDSKIQSEKDLAVAVEKQKELLAEVAEMEEDALTVITSLEETKALLTTYEQRLGEEHEHVAKLKLSIREAKGKEEELAVEIQNCQGAIDDNKKTFNSLNNEILALSKAHDEDLREYAAMTNEYLVQPQIPANEASEPMEVCGGGPTGTKAPLPTFTSEEIVAMISGYEGSRKNHTIRDEIKADLSHLEGERDRLKGSVNMGAIQEYLKRDAEYRTRYGELEIATQERNLCRKNYEDLRKQRLEDFMKGFGVISLRLKEMYQMITLGGDAELELVDSLDPFSGIATHFNSWHFLIVCRGYCIFRATAKEKLEEHIESIWRRKDTFVSRPCVRAAPLPTDSALRDGRD